MKKSRLWVLILILVLVIIFVVTPMGKFLMNQFSMTATVDKVDSAVTISDEEFEVDLHGINVPDAHLADLKDKTIFLNFWGTWCPPCVKEWPTIQELYNAKKDKMAFVLIAMEDQEPKVREFLKKNNYTVPVYIASSPLSPRFLVSIFPTTFIIKDGKIIRKDEGAQDWNSGSERTFVDEITK